MNKKEFKDWNKATYNGSYFKFKYSMFIADFFPLELLKMAIKVYIYMFIFLADGIIKRLTFQNYFVVY